ncbi:MAG: redox-sensing transcriptional repressor Rex [Thermoanaerobaculia bacterium]
MNPAARPRRDGAVSEAATHRLSLLLRGLRQLEEEGVGTVSSLGLAHRFGMNAAQIRKDLAHLGEFGVRGVGYRVSDLRARLGSILGLDRVRVVVIVGAGHLGQALADSRNFNGESFRVGALFDVDGRKVGGRSRTGIPILHAKTLRESVEELGAEIGIVTVPAESAAGAARALAEAGIRRILNFAPATIGALPGATVRNVDLTLSLETLAIQLPVKG